MQGAKLVELAVVVRATSNNPSSESTDTSSRGIQSDRFVGTGPGTLAAVLTPDSSDHGRRVGPDLAWGTLGPISEVDLSGPWERLF